MSTPIADESDHFQAAVHRMRDAFVEMKADRQGWERYDELVGDFFDGYQQAKRSFGNVLLHRDMLKAPRP
jgi:hypothetical protein